MCVNKEGSVEGVRIDGAFRVCRCILGLRVEGDEDVGDGLNCGGNEGNGRREEEWRMTV